MAEDGDPELLASIGPDEIIQGIIDWADAHPDEFLDAISFGFDVEGEQEAVGAKPSDVRKIVLADGSLYARVRFKVTYRNPVDEFDRELLAENVADDTFDVQLTDPHVNPFRFSELDLAPEGIFPT